MFEVRPKPGLVGIVGAGGAGLAAAQATGRHPVQPAAGSSRQPTAPMRSQPSSSQPDTTQIRSYPLFRDTSTGWSYTHDYRTAEPFADKDVVVVGAGCSAGELACEIAGTARSVALSARSGNWVVRRRLPGAARGRHGAQTRRDRPTAPRRASAPDIGVRGGSGRANYRCRRLSTHRSTAGSRPSPSDHETCPTTERLIRLDDAHTADDNHKREIDGSPRGQRIERRPAAWPVRTARRPAGQR
jgi:hypothetical protein